jgi:hypothetical protein
LAHAKCEGDTNAFPKRFGEMLAAHRGRNVLVVPHHPILSGGPHGGQSRGFWMDLGVTVAYPSTDRRTSSSRDIRR